MKRICVWRPMEQVAYQRGLSIPKNACEVTGFGRRARPEIPSRRGRIFRLGAATECFYNPGINHLNFDVRFQ
jgi:hypothetical protein